MLITDDITVNNVEKLLTGLFDNATRVSDFKYHGGQPTNIWIYVYPSHENFRSRSDGWVGMVFRNGEGSQPEWSIRKEYIASLAAPPVHRFGLSEGKRKEVYWLLVEAEDKARRQAETTYPLDPELHLAVGQSIVLKEETPLMPEVNPADAGAALAKIRQLPSGSRVEITKIAMKDSSPWYAVRILGTSGLEAGVGWINSAALIGQIDFDSASQLRRQSELDDQLVDSSKKDIARKFHLTDEQVRQVEEEGLDKYWPSP